MSRNDDVTQAIGTGWTLFDWTPGNRIPWVRIAGCMPATRIQLDRYRQNLQMVGKEGQIQLWCWSTSTFTATHRYNNAGVQTDARTPQAYPEAATVETSVTPREFRPRTVTLPGGGTTLPWGSGIYQTTRSTATPQMTIASRFFGQFAFAWFSGYNSRLVMSSTSGVKVRILVVGQHNRSWSGILP
jgi:hypothetical protein